jgi:DNA helicase-2/ATP-dependent DNA helicase PcrA
MHAPSGSCRTELSYLRTVKSFLEDLNPVQRDAVRAIDGPVMIIAGAGSGKTRVLTYRAAHLLHLGVRADSVLALTFTNKAADEMKGRIRSLVGDASRSVWMGTFHSLFARILRRECEHLGYGRNFSIYDTDDSLSAIKSVMTVLKIPQQQFSPQAIRARISSAKNQMISPSAYRQTAVDPMSDRTAEVYQEYEKRLKRSNAMDFDDLLLKALELFTKRKSALERYQERFAYILVDEYQDTNRVQYSIIKELARKRRNICVVGDDAQSIYAFRGADIRNILDFERDYPDATIFRLEQNYRSTGKILAAADSLIKQNVDQIPKTLWTANPDGESIQLIVCDDDRQEGQSIVNAIEGETRRRKLHLNDFAVLYRTNAQSRAIEDAFRRAGIPYVLVGGVEFYKRREIKDVLAYLKVIVNPQDGESLARIINIPARGIGETTLKKLARLGAAETKPLIDVMGRADLAKQIGDRAARAVLHFHTMVRKYIDLKSSISASELARALVDEIGMLRLLKEENTPESLSRRENILELVSALTEYFDHHPDARLEDFLEEVSLVSDVDLADFSHNAVTLMTLHAAKGLEFPVVFITGLEEGLFPLSNSALDRKEMEEERRLMYVGITRAQQQLYLTYALMRYRFGELSYSVKSRFLDEVDQRFVEVTRSAKRAVSGTMPGAHLGTLTSSVGHTRRRQPRPADDLKQYFSDPTPAYEDESQEIHHLRVGARIVHESFGSGRIVAINGQGESAKAVVEFDSVGRKLLLLKYAHLRAG